MSTRLCIEFGPDQSEALGRMACALNTSKAGVLRYALSLFQIARHERREGNALGVIRNGRVVKEIVGVWDADDLDQNQARSG